MKYKVLIIGAAGRIGFEIIKFFKEDQNIEAIGVVRNQIAASLLELHSCKALVYNLENEEMDFSMLNKLKIDVIINTAIEFGYPSYSYKKNYNILKNLVKIKPKLIINFSSISVYGKKLFDKKSINNLSVSPNNFYSRLKYFLENKNYYLCKKEKINLLNLRLGNVYGESQLWSEIIKDLLSNKNIQLPFGGNNKANSLHINNLTYLLSKIVVTNNNYKGQHTFNCIDNENKTWKDLILLHVFNSDKIFINDIDLEENLKFKKRNLPLNYNIFQIIYLNIKIFINKLFLDEYFKDKISFFLNLFPLKLKKNFY